MTSTAPTPPNKLLSVPQVSRGVSCPGWRLILDLIIYEWALVLTSGFPPDHGAQVSEASRLGGLCGWQAPLRTGVCPRYKGRERATEETGASARVLPEAGHCSCISSPPPSTAPKHNDPLYKPAPKSCCSRVHRLPSSQLLFFFFFLPPRPTQPPTVRGKSLPALKAGPTTESILRLVTLWILSQDSERQTAKSLAPT